MTLFLIPTQVPQYVYLDAVSVSVSEKTLTTTILKTVQLVIQHILPVNFVSFVYKHIEIYFASKGNITLHIS